MMDSLITAAARALATGDPLGALKRVALRDDAPALALRGIAMAQLGEYGKARSLLRHAARSFGPREPLARARCLLAEAEVALVSRDLQWPAQALSAARRTLLAHADHTNAAHAQLLESQRLLLIGRLDKADRLLREADSARLPPPLRAAHELATAALAMRLLRTADARAALTRAGQALRRAPIPALMAELAGAMELLGAPAARVSSRGSERLLRLSDVELLLASKTLVIDACRHVVRRADAFVPLTSRPVLFALARTLALAWPADVSREALIAQLFRIRRIDDSHRARLRVEIGRLRKMLAGLAEISATAQGFSLTPVAADDICVLLPPTDGPHAEVLALLADGERWSSSALALALDVSQRSVQRSLESLARAGKVQAVGRGRTRRWVAPPLPGFATTLLLPATLPGD